jgi:tetratricopeptide (TPR) repeat protein
MIQIAQHLKDKNLLVESLLQLANCLYERGDKEKAKVWYLQILKRADPDCREAKEKLSIIAPELIEKMEKAKVARKEVVEVPKKQKKVKVTEPPVKQKKEKVSTADKKEVIPEKEAVLEEPEFIDLGEELRKELEKEEKEPQTKEEKEKEIFRQIEESIYTHAQKTDPVDALEVGMAMKELGLIEDAISNLKKALEGEDKVKKEAYHLLGQIFLEMEQPEIALENLKNAISIKIDNSEKDRVIHYDLARAYESVGEWAKAVKHYKIIYEQDPSSKELKQKILELARKIKSSRKNKG